MFEFKFKHSLTVIHSTLELLKPQIKFVRFEIFLLILRLQTARRDPAWVVRAGCDIFLKRLLDALS